MKQFCILFFGADGSWEHLTKTGFTRRNTNMLLAMVEHPEVEVVFNVQFLTRGQWFKSITNNLKNSTSSKPCIDLGVVPFIPLSLPGSKRINSMLNQMRIARAIKGFKSPTISWCYWPKGYRIWKNYWNQGCMVFDADHNIANDPHIPANQLNVRKHELLTIEMDAQILVSSSRSMNNWFKLNEKARLLMNGVDNRRFSKTKPECIARNKPPVIGYLGTLSKWMEIDWLIRLAQNHPDWQFKIGGVNHQTSISEKLNKLSNVELFGKVLFADVPNFLASLDIGLSLYKPEPELDVNSMKVYEYLSAYVPVVALRNHPHFDEDFGDLLDSVSTYSELEETIQRNLDQPKDEQWQHEIAEFLSRSQWSTRAEEAIAIIKEFQTVN